MVSFAIDDLVKNVAKKLGEVAATKTVIGEPIVLGDVTIIPVSRVSMGMGGGGAEGEGAPGGGKRPGSGKGTGLGAGGAVKVAPVAIIAFTPTGVQVLPVPDRQNWLERLADRIPEWIEKAAEKRSC